MIKRKDGRYQETVMVTIRGRKRRKYFYGWTKAEVKRKIVSWRSDQERGRPFDVVCEEWQKEHFTHIFPWYTGFLLVYHYFFAFYAIAYTIVTACVNAKCSILWNTFNARRALAVR